MVGPTMNLISEIHHSCERREHAFMVFQEYTIIFLVYTVGGLSSGPCVRAHPSPFIMTSLKRYSTPQLLPTKRKRKKKKEKEKEMDVYVYIKIKIKNEKYFIIHFIFSIIILLYFLILFISFIILF